MSVGVVLGVAPGAVYAGLVGAVHRGVSGRWDRVSTFAVGCVVAGALFGLLGGIGWALSGEVAPGSRPPADRPHLPGRQAITPRTGEPPRASEVVEGYL
jgi:hypothetical protein